MKFKKKKYPLIPLKDTVFLPYEQRLIMIGRNFSINALKHAAENYNNYIIFVTQKLDDEDQPNQDSFYNYGVIGQIIETQQICNNNFQIKIIGLKRIKLSNVKYNKSNQCFLSNYTFIDPDIQDNGTLSHVDATHVDTKLIKWKHEDLLQFNALKKIYLKKLEAMRSQYSAFINISIDNIVEISEPELFIFKLINILVNNNDIKIKLLSQSIVNIMEWILTNLDEKISITNLELDIAYKTQESIKQKQEEYLLREKLNILKEIQGSNSINEIDVLKKRIKDLNAPDHVKSILDIEINKLNSIQPMSSEYYVIKNYIENILDIPWSNRINELPNIPNAQKILDASHFGLQDVKLEILKSISLFLRKPKSSPTVLLLVGPPGIGKTSICKSIAEAMKRPLGYISLAGMSDVAKLYGQMRTYVGAIPGLFIQVMKRMKVKNCVMQLDEIDKINQDSWRDPMKVLVALLDPEQNTEFKDQYLDIGFDCSEIMFILTANNLNKIPNEIINRVKIIHLSGYTDKEKMEISTYILKKELERSGLTNKEVSILPSAIKTIIMEYTRESGVRNLMRNIRAVLESVLLDINLSKIKSTKVDSKSLLKWIGEPQVTNIEKAPTIGVCRGLAWTSIGGEILFIECISFNGKEELIITGNLGDIMKESIKIVFDLIKSQIDVLKININKIKNKTIHVHVPEGAIPKDGPSAGITIFCALLSLFLNKPIKNDIAMTGEVNLCGDVMKIGGLKEKLIAALRNKMKVVLIPKDNGLSEIPNELKNGLKILPISNIAEAVPHIF